MLGEKRRLSQEKSWSRGMRQSPIPDNNETALVFIINVLKGP